MGLLGPEVGAPPYGDGVMAGPVVTAPAGGSRARESRVVGTGPWSVVQSDPEGCVSPAAASAPGTRSAPHQSGLSSCHTICSSTPHSIRRRTTNSSAARSNASSTLVLSRAPQASSSGVPTVMRHSPWPRYRRTKFTGALTVRFSQQRVDSSHLTVRGAGSSESWVGECSTDEEHPEAVVVSVAEASGDASMQFDESVDGYLEPACGAGRCAGRLRRPHVTDGESRLVVRRGRSRVGSVGRGSLRGAL